MNTYKLLRICSLQKLAHTDPIECEISYSGMQNSVLISSVMVTSTCQAINRDDASSN